MLCSNCGKTPGPDSLRITKGGSPLECVTEVCEACYKGVAVLKIVLKREKATDEFAFEGLLPAESFKE